MKSYVHYLKSHGHSNLTVECNYKALSYYLNWCEDANITAEQGTYQEVLGYVQTIQKRGIKQRTVQLYLNAVKHYFDWQIKRGIRRDNPVTSIEVKGIKRKQLYQVLSREELDKLYYNFLAETPVAKRNKVMVGLMIWQGLDSQSLKTLTVKDVKLRAGEIEVTGNRKSNSRTLHLSPPQVIDLMEYLLQDRKELLVQSGQESESLLVSTGGGSRFSVLVQQVMKTLKSQGVSSLQQIRTSVIVHWLKQYNLREVQYKAGHRYVSSTEAYQINDLEELQEDVNQYYPL